MLQNMNHEVRLDVWLSVWLSDCLSFCRYVCMYVEVLGIKKVVDLDKISVLIILT